jgi:hypothetical protein
MSNSLQSRSVQHLLPGSRPIASRLDLPSVYGQWDPHRRCRISNKGFHTFLGWGETPISDRAAEVDEMPESKKTDKQLPCIS